MGASFARVAARHMSERRAGLFDAPPAMLRDIGAWMTETYAGHVLANALPLLERAQDATAVFRKGLAVNAAAEGLVASAASLAVGEHVKFPVHDVTFSGQYEVEQWGIKRVEDGEIRGGDGGIGPRFVIGYGQKAVSWKPSRAPLSYQLMGMIPLELAQKGVRNILLESSARLQKQIDHPRPNDDLPDLVEVSLLVRELRTYTGKAKAYSTSAKRVFPIDVAGWRYVKAGDPTPASVGWDKLTAVLDFKGTQHKGGHWAGEERELLVELGSGSVSGYVRTSEQARTVAEFRYGLSEMLRILRHELRHVGQDVLAAIHGVSEDAGLPSRSTRDLEYGSSGRKLDAPVDERGRTLMRTHPLRDVEFYTRLGDEVDRFVRFSRKIPMNLRRDALRSWVGALDEEVLDPNGERVSAPQEFFAMLKRHEPGKWRKAVAEFYKAVADAGVRVPDAARVAARFVPPSKRELVDLAEMMMVVDLGDEEGEAWLRDPNRKRGRELLDYFTRTYGEDWWESAWRMRMR